MKEFTNLILKLDQTTSTNEKVSALAQYFKFADETDKLRAVYILFGNIPKRVVTSKKMKEWAIEFSKLPSWLFEDSYSIVGDLSETIALILPKASYANKNMPITFEGWINYISSFKRFNDKERKLKLFSAWDSLNFDERFVFNKLILGNFRIGVSKSLIIKALSKVTNIDEPVLHHRFSGKWSPTETTINEIASRSSFNIAVPYPLFLASPLEDKLNELSEPNEWIAEWKWDGIRAQIVKRNNEIFIWSRDEELVTEKFPEFNVLKDKLPDGTVIDGELLAYKKAPLPFNLLQTRIERKSMTQKILEEAPAALIAYDILEYEGKDIRNLTLEERKKILESIVKKVNDPILNLSYLIDFKTWDELATIQSLARENYAEGVMLKRKSSTYQVGRMRGDWWKWKVNPLSVDALLIYAQKGHGRLYTDYTFAVWDNDNNLVTFAKAYSGLTDEEINEVNRFVLENTIQKFGPVRAVKAQLVFEIGFEGIQKSPRHKSGVAVRFPRILKWRHDKLPKDADNLQTLQNLLTVYG